MITVFTPSYNRANLLPRLYQSLVNQTNHNFLWLIVDDGSTDATESVAKKIIQENRLKIDYRYKENGGLNSAYNFAVNITKNEIFFRVDSDDQLLPCAIEQIYAKWNLVQNDSSLCGLVFLSQFSDGRSVGIHPFTNIQRCDFFSYRDKFHAKGDRAEVIKTDVLKKYPFPYFAGENFCPEGLMWNRIAKNYDALYIPCAIYVREYMPDSITSSIVRVLKKNARGASSYYAELIAMKPKFLYFSKNALLYWRYAFFNKQGLIKNLKAVPFLVWFYIFPALGILFIDKLCGR